MVWAMPYLHILKRMLVRRADLGYANVERSMVKEAALKACNPVSTIHHLPFKVTPEMVEEALLVADLMGKQFKRNIY